jgi:uncharacterized membrane protein
MRSSSDRTDVIVDWAAVGGAVAFSALALGLYGAGRRTLSGACVTLGAAPLLLRGVAGHWPASPAGEDTKTALSRNKGIAVREAIRLECPVSEVFRYWRRLENLPRFMTYLESVTQNGIQSHWIAKGPGHRVEWDAEIINEVENEVIGWRSLPGSEIVTAGSVRFDSVRGGRNTQVTVHLRYAPPAGRAGDLVAKLFGRAPSQTIREDLRRFKQLLEAGEVARAKPQEAQP